MAKHGSEAKKAREDGLKNKAKRVLGDLCKKYEEPGNVDSALRVIGQVEGVKAQMQKNISGM